MGVYTFVCKQSGAEWSAKQLSGDLEASAGTTFDLQRSLVKAALSSDYGAVQSSFSLVTPSSAVFQVIIGAAAAAVSGGAAPAAAASTGGAPAEAPKEEKKPEKEESDDDDLGFSLFD